MGTTAYYFIKSLKLEGDVDGITWAARSLIEEKNLQINVLSKPSLSNFDPKIVLLIKLANNKSTSVEEARSAAMQACKRLGKI